MTEALVVSNALLWLLVLVLAGVVLALVRQIGVLHERVAPAGALLGREAPRIGETPAPVELADLAGRPLRIGGAGPEGAATLLLFVSPTCPVCEVLLPIARRMRDAEAGRLRLVIASDGPASDHERFVRAHALEAEHYVLSTELGLLYQVARLPHAVLLDETGRVRARGLVNTREHLESLFEARDRGVASVQDLVA